MHTIMEYGAELRAIAIIIVQSSTEYQSWKIFRGPGEPTWPCMFDVISGLFLYRLDYLLKFQRATARAVKHDDHADGETGPGNRPMVSAPSMICTP